MEMKFFANWYVPEPGITSMFAKHNSGFYPIDRHPPKASAFALGETVAVVADEASRDRIIACVNACAGMDDPGAEIAALRRAANATSKD